MGKEQPPVIRRRKNNGEIEQTRIENGKEIIIPNDSPEKLTGEPDTEKDLLAMEQKMKGEINGFLAQKHGIKENKQE